jgi:hypothetical protein
MFYSFQNDLGLAIVVGVFLQCRTFNIGLGGASLNLSNVITTNKFQHFLVIMSENFKTLFWLAWLERNLHHCAYVNPLFILIENLAFIWWIQTPPHLPNGESSMCMKNERNKSCNYYIHLQRIKLKWFILHNHNSSMFKLVLEQPPCKMA